jgi:hypothetical protein
MSTASFLVAPAAGQGGHCERRQLQAGLLLCLRTGYLLPGKKTIPDQIAEGRKPYYDALEAADKALTDVRMDLTEMEALLSSLLARQLVEVFDDAMGAPSSHGVSFPGDAFTESPKEAKGPPERN